MSILNAIIRDDAALVVVDTEGRHIESGRRWHCNKIAAFPATRAVLAGRGCLGTLWSAACGLATTGGAFDDMVSALPGFAAEAWSNVARHVVTAGLPEREADAEFLAVGWSDRAAAIVGAFCAPGDGWAVHELRGAVHCAPWHADLGGPAPTAASAADLAALVPRQLAYHRAMAPQVGCGGRMLACQITRDAIVFTDGGPIEDPAA